MLALWFGFWSWPTLPVVNTQIFNRVRGVTWSIDREIQQSTLVQTAQNGRPIRIPNWQQPLWSFKYRWGYVKDGFGPALPGNTYTDLKTLWGQILPFHGQAVDFLYQPDDSNVQGQTLIVDVNGNAEITHSIGGYQESVQYITFIEVFFNGIKQPNPTIAQPSTVAPYLGYVIQSVPANTIVTVNFIYYYKAMLDTDISTFENFMNLLWKWQTGLTFKQVRV